jgi:hypothetical protein
MGIRPDFSSLGHTSHEKLAFLGIFKEKWEENVAARLNLHRQVVGEGR